MADDAIVLDTATLILRETPSSEAKIKYWREVLRARCAMPPIEVMAHGKGYNGRPRYWVYDGHHRIEAARREGALAVAATVDALKAAPAVASVTFCCFSRDSATLHEEALAAFGSPCPD